MTEGSSRDGQAARRSQRVTLQIPVHVEYFVEAPGLLATDTVTVVVNAHGALLRLPWGVLRGQQLRLRNLLTREIQDANVVVADRAADGFFDVGVEFTQPNPKFWGLQFPPEDWSPSHPDAKQKQNV